jgi:hypothetical protein
MRMNSKKNKLPIYEINVQNCVMLNINIVFTVNEIRHIDSLSRSTSA